MMGKAITLEFVPGMLQKGNGVLLKRVRGSTGSVIFFGGDVQNFTSEMEKDQFAKKHLQWSLEKVCEKLSLAFPSRSIVVFQPCRMENSTFSCFDNFVMSDKIGCPNHLKTKQACQHLMAVLRNIEIQLKDDDFLALSRKCLVGFSKGVVVLNQILFEIAQFKESNDPDLELANFISTIDSMVWIDGGHNGGKETWIKKQDILKHLVHQGIKVDVRVTPYQIRDRRRPWIGQEEELFSQFLKQNSQPGKFRRHLFFDDEKPSLENHFKALDTFEPNDKFFH